MGVVVKCVGLVPGLDDPGQAVNRQIHQAQLGVILHLLLAVKGHGVVGKHPGALHKVSGLDEHSAAAAGRVYVPTDFDTKEKALSVAKAAEKGLK